MKKYVVYFENWDGVDEWEMFDKEEDAEKYIEEQENEEQLAPEEDYFIQVEER